MGALAGAGSDASAGGGIHAELPHPARRWLSRRAQAVALFTSSSPSVRCTEESSPRSRSLAPFTFSKVVPLGSASAALTAASRRSCAVTAPAGADIVGATGCGQVLMTVFETSI